MAEIEWKPIKNIFMEEDRDEALIEAQRKIAEELNRLNDNIEKIIESGVPEHDPDE